MGNKNSKKNRRSAILADEQTNQINQLPPPLSARDTRSNTIQNIQPLPNNNLIIPNTNALNNLNNSNNNPPANNSDFNNTNINLNGSNSKTNELILDPKWQQRSPPAVKRRETVGTFNIEKKRGKEFNPLQTQRKLEGREKEEEYDSLIFVQGDFPNNGYGLAKFDVPTLFDSLKTEIEQICFGEAHCLLLTKEGKLYSFGKNKSVLGRNTNEEIGLVDCPFLIKKASCGKNFSAFLTERGKIYSFGRNESGCCGKHFW